jgi:hypothetical protein
MGLDKFVGRTVAQDNPTPEDILLASVVEAEQNGFITSAHFYSITYLENCITTNTNIIEIETYLQHY